MTREKAIEIWDRLVELGYSASLSGKDMGGYIDPDGSSIAYHVKVTEISVDSVDLRVLVELADNLDVQVGFSPIGGNSIYFSDRDRAPQVVANPRRHPKK